jgi:phosphoglycolate phosphatase
MKKLVVFDWNGVLLADTNACVDADNRLLKVFGGKSITLKQFRDTFCVPAIDFLAHHGCKRKVLEKNVQKLGEIFKKEYEPRAAKCRTRQGARELLDWLSQNSINTIIISNHTVEGINSQLKRLKLENYFSEVLANSDQANPMKGRNKKEKLAKYLKFHRMNSNSAIIIGDSTEEIEIGKELGLATIAITNGYYSEARLKAKKPDYLIRNLFEVKRILENGAR